MSGEIAVNLLWCVPGRVGGSEEYLSRQLVGLGETAPGLAGTARLYVLPGFAAAHPELAGYPLVTAPVDGNSRARRVHIEATWLRRHAARAALMHHGGGTVPPRSPRPIVLTVHDLQYLTLPHYFSTVKLRYLTAIVPHSVRRAKVVAVPSRYVGRTVIEAFGVEPDRVVVVPHGVAPPEPDTLPRTADLRARYGLGGEPFVVYPAITHPHKGHRFLIDLLAGPWRSRDLTLLLLGQAGSADGAVRESIELAGLSQRVVRPGRVPSEDRDGLIASAEALVFPSEYEGFGAPVLEAMALDTPVIASDRAALPEVVGDAGLVLPLTAEAWAGALDVVATERDRLVAAGRARASVFSAEASGLALASAYMSAVA